MKFFGVHFDAEIPLGLHMIAKGWISSIKPTLVVAGIIVIISRAQETMTGNLKHS